MARSKFFEYGILWHPTDEQAKNGQKSKIVCAITTVLAHDEKGAVILASQEIPKEMHDQLDQVEITVRPF